MRLNYLRTVLSITGLALCLGLPRLVSAQLKITEVHPNPTASGDASEWIELWNDTEANLDLIGWNLDGEELLESFVIESQEVVVITKDLQAFNSEFGDFVRSVSMPMSLRNSGDQVSLSKYDQLIQVEYPAIAAEESWELNATECDQFGVNSEHSLGYVNFSVCDEPEVIVDFTNKLVVSEVMPNPEGADADAEWVEIKNNSSQDLDLNGLFIYDLTGRIFEFGPESIVAPNEYLVANLEGSKLGNCSSDGCIEQVNLVYNDTVIDGFSYGSTKSGQSWSLTDTGLWSLNYKLTKGRENRPRISQISEPRQSSGTPQTVAAPAVESTNSEPSSSVNPQVSYVPEYKIEKWIPDPIPAQGPTRVFVPLWPGFLFVAVMGGLILLYDQGVYARLWNWWVT